MYRGYQGHDLFDLWQEEKKYFVCRIKASTKKGLFKVLEGFQIALDNLIYLTGCPSLLPKSDPALH
jgi:hypothetical protein